MNGHTHIQYIHYMYTHTYVHTPPYVSIYLETRQKNQCPPVGQNRPIVQPSHGQQSYSQNRTAQNQPQSPCSKRRLRRMIKTGDSQPFRRTGTLGLSGWVAPQTWVCLIQRKKWFLQFHVYVHKHCPKVMTLTFVLNSLHTGGWWILFSCLVSDRCQIHTKLMLYLGILTVFWQPVVSDRVSPVNSYNYRISKKL